MKKNKANNSGSERFEDIISSSSPSDFKGKTDHWFKYRFKPFFLRNHKRNLKALISIVVCFAVLVGITAVFYAKNILDLVNYDEGYSGDADATFAQELEEDMSFRSMYDITDADSLKDLLRSWATNGGEKLSSRNVVNVLLIGQDNDDGSHRSDSMILVSLNKKTQKITLTSFLRDSYTYMNINGDERFDKTNHSYAWGGPATLIETIENNYKIEIDHYVTINFESFVKAIDAVGGVNVEVTEAEASYMNRTTRFNDFTSGKSVHLDGDHALIFSRIRKLDSEAERTRRQRLVIMALIQQSKSASVGQLNNLLDTLLPYITTNYSRREILSLGTQALSNGWMDYEILTLTEPAEETRKGVNMATWSYSNLFVWVVDYPVAAQALQNALYGTSNIGIDPLTHQSALDMLVASPAYSSEGDNNYSYNNDNDNDYDYDDEEETTEDSGRPSSWWTRPSIFGPGEEETEESTSEQDYEEETTSYEEPSETEAPSEYGIDPNEIFNY